MASIPPVETQEDKPQDKIMSRDTDKKIPPLFRLPAELRNHIYELGVVKPEPIQVVHAIFIASSTQHNSPIKPPALAQVCRRLRNEVLPIYYGENNFSVYVIFGGGSRGWTSWHMEYKWERLVAKWLVGASEENKRLIGEIDYQIITTSPMLNTDRARRMSV